MDDFPKEKPRFWIAMGLLLTAFALAVVMSVFLTVKAHAQEPQPGPICAPMVHLIPAWQEVHQERVIWEGTSPTPQGPIELVLLQSASGTWSLFVVQGGVGCLRAAGNSGTPVATDKGV